VRKLPCLPAASKTLDLFSEAEQLRRIWGASLGTARRNEKATQQRLKEERAKRRRNAASEI